MIRLMPSGSCQSPKKQPYYCRKGPEEGFNESTKLKSRKLRRSSSHWRRDAFFPFCGWKGALGGMPGNLLLAFAADPPR